MVDCKICGSKTHHRFVFCDDCALDLYEYIENGAFTMFIKHPELYELAIPEHDLAGSWCESYIEEQAENYIWTEQFSDESDEDYMIRLDDRADYWYQELNGTPPDYYAQVMYRLWYANYLFGYISKTKFNDWNDPESWWTTSQTVNNLHGRCGIQKQIKIPLELEEYIISEYVNLNKSTYDLEYEFQMSHGISRNHITALLKLKGVLRPPNCTRRMLHKKRKESDNYYAFME